METVDSFVDKVQIIDWLPDADRARHKVSLEIEGVVKAAGYPVNVQYVNTKQGVVNLLDSLANQDQKVLLHFVAHGGKEGIGLPDGSEIILWEELGPLLEAINNRMNGTLILNMTTCKGLFAIKSVLHSNNNAVFGVIGPAQDIEFITAKEVNAIFYSELIAKKPIPRIVDLINQRTQTVHCISSEGYKELKKQFG